VRLLRHCFLDEAADVRQAGVGSARAARLDRRRVGVQANDANALVRLNAGGGHSGGTVFTSFLKRINSQV
jgi:hypothetical protein